MMVRSLCTTYWAVKHVSYTSARWGQHFIYQKLTDSHIRALVFFIVMLKHLLEYFVLVIIKILYITTFRKFL